MDAPEGEVEFRVLTLNCWAIAIKGFETKLRKERVAAIAERLREAAYEIVALQEIWSQDDYTSLLLGLQERLPFSHYFYSGFTGSGICVFSKYPILQTMWHTYPMSGYAHKLHHGDWYGGSGVGLCKLQIGQAVVNLYISHVHARYSFDETEEYVAHRTTQMLNLAQFIRHTSEVCSAVLLCGDLNTEDGELGYQLLRSQALLKDAWAEKNPITEYEGASKGETHGSPDNPFTNRKALKHRPRGMRIDYVMYRQNDQNELSCGQCLVTMGQIPNKSYNYSDHEAVLAYFRLRRDINARRQPEAVGEVQVECLRRTGRLLDDAQRQCRFHRSRHAVLAALWLIVLVLAREQFLGDGGWHVLNELVQAVAAVTAAACGWSALVLLRVDSNSLQQHRRDVSNLLNAGKYLSDQLGPPQTGLF